MGLAHSVILTTHDYHIYPSLGISVDSVYYNTECNQLEGLAKPPSLDSPSLAPGSRTFISILAYQDLHKGTYCVPGNVGMVQIFVYFIQFLAIGKFKSTKIFTFEM